MISFTVVGYILMLPLDHKKIEKILNEEESVLDTQTKEIRAFEPGKAFRCHAESCVTAHFRKARKLGLDWV
jgi:hypothetical protein